MLELHRAERADHLVEALAGVLATPPADPFAEEVVAVPSRGVERWLAQRLSHRLGSAPGREDGVCARVGFPSPAELLAGALAGATGVRREEDPWHPRRLPWPLLQVLDACTGERGFELLTAHLAREGRRFATAQRLAGLFDGYAAYRPEMIEAWAAGRDEDGLGTRLPDTLRWQAEAWRRLRETIGTDSPAERLAPASERLRREPGVAALPGRLSLFGPTRLASADLTVLTALAEHREVHLWLPHPSPELWRRVAAHAPSGPVRRAADPTAAEPRHPLLASLGRDARELQVRLAATGAPSRDVHHPGPEAEPVTLLQRLQRSVREDAAPGAEPARLDAEDRSFAVHACHGPDRQVEVLRDALLGLLEGSAGSGVPLEPRDVLVMCPDIETYAPLIAASFGLGQEAAAEGEPSHPAHRLRVRLADRALREVNPLLGVVASLLELADARITAAQLVDLLADGPVRARLDLDEDDVDRLRELVRRAEVRWGLDAAHRRLYRLGDFGQNTWTAGLARMLLGVAMPEEEGHWLGTALPLDDVDSGDVTLVGRLAEFVDRVRSVLAELEGSRPPAHWTAALIRALDLLTLVPSRDAWQSTQARAVLAEIESAAAGTDPSLTRADVRSLLADRLQGRPTRANFRTGTLTMCTMVPMRSVPHRVVCLLGIDDGVFPRTRGTDGDDVLALEPCVGDRDPRSEDRQLLLDAVLAAGEHLVVVYSGRDERTNARRPPAVPIAELLDTVDALAVGPEGRPAREHVVVEHPLQPFDPANFTGNALGTPGPFSFDEAAVRGARRAIRPRPPAPPLIPRMLPPAAEEPGAVVSLDDLVRFVEHPAQAFLRQRVGISTYRDDDGLEDSLPIEPDGLADWKIGDRLLRDRLRGATVEDCRAAEWRRGALPPGPLGRAKLDTLLGKVEPLVVAGRAVLTVEEPAVIDVDLTLPAGRLVGSVAGVHDSTLVEVSYSRLAPKHRLKAWVRLLALTAAGAVPEPVAVTIGRGDRGRLLRSDLGPVAAPEAAELLSGLLALRREGLREPLPLPCDTGHAYARERLGGTDVALALVEADRVWATDKFPERAGDLAHELCWGPAARLEVLTAAPAVTAGVASAAVALATEPTRFGDLAMRLWRPLTAHESLGAV